ncbi:hypothetical protein LEP1GSC172_3765 [Leptospira noguchii]|uniref:Uncharacterized protein n=1 Tax=Leptospira noguchii TaxID=28182 RepID=M6VLW3_9LEPT|nr:hypothetical protein LEP1GSC172_3765 [Leptospira noguchii]
MLPLSIKRQLINQKVLIVETTFIDSIFYFIRVVEKFHNPN